MTNFTRKFLDEFAKDNKNTDLTVYGSTANGGSIVSSDPEILQSNPKFREGWKGATLENLTNNTRNPVRNEWSALDYIHNYHINSILQKGGQDYNVLTEYFIGDLVKDEGTAIFYKSITNNNIGNALTDIANWQLIGNLEDLQNLAQASETAAGIAELATQAETDAGTDDLRIVTPLKLQNKVASETAAGIAELATQAETDAGTDDTKAITPLKLQGKFDLETPDNVVLVKQESDFGTPSGGVITLVNNTIYRVTGQVLMTSRLSLPDRSRITIKGSSYAGMDELVFLFGAGVAIDIQGQAGTFHIFDLNITDATGLATLINGNGDGSFTEQSIFIYVGGNIQNFGFFGNIENYFTVVLRRLFCFETAALLINNVAALTVNAFLWKNFTTKGTMLDIRTNISQAALTEVSLLPAQNDIPFSVDPAIVNESGISITLFPYNGFVFVNAVNFADNGGGGTTVTTAIGHSFNNSNYVFFLSGTYAGVHQISSVVNKQADVTWGSVGLFDIPVAFAGNDLTRPLVYLFDITSSQRFILPFYRQGVTGVITSISDNGSGFARVNSIAHGLATGQSLFISDTDAYDAGYYIIVIDVDNFDLLDSFGQPVPFTTPETGGSWDTSSLNEKNNVISVQNTGGILPDSQTLGNNILTTTVSAAAATTAITETNAGGWLTDEGQRFKATSTGGLLYIGRTNASVSLSASFTTRKVGGGVSTASINFMIKKQGELIFTEIPNHRRISGAVQSSDDTTLSIPFRNHLIEPQTEIKIGYAADTSITIDILSAEINIKK